MAVPLPKSIPTLPDAEVSMDGTLSGYKTLGFKKAPTRGRLLQTEDKVWRNVVIWTSMKSRQAVFSYS